jgi:hypothetical protein
MEEVNPSSWSGSVFIGNRRILFVGQAGTSTNQAVHAIKICVAFNGQFELAVGGEERGKQYSAVVVNADIKHTVICNGADIFLLYLLPETEEAMRVRREYLNRGNSPVSAIAKDSVVELLGEQQVLQNYWKWGCGIARSKCEDVIRGLGAIRSKELSPSTSLSSSLSADVARTVEYIFSELNAVAQRRREYSKDRFEPSVIAVEAGTTEKIDSRFKERVGISIDHYHNDIQLLFALKLYAVSEKKRGDLKRIAGLIGIGDSDDFSHRVRSRLGISHSDLQGGTFFFECRDLDGDH